MIVKVKQPTQEEKEKRIITLEFTPENLEELLSCLETEMQINGKESIERALKLS